MGYLANFIVYTLAMVGVIVVALLVFKNSVNFHAGNKSKHLKVLDSITIAPRKTLYIVSAGQEKFLIAGDVNETTLISKLENNLQEDLGQNAEKNDYIMQNIPRNNTANLTINSNLMKKNSNFSNNNFIKRLIK